MAASHEKTVGEVKSLVASVVEHTKFRQLAVYSIDTFTKVLGPPNTRWREYIDVAIEIDAASAVIKVIKKHPGNEEVLTAATRCLTKLAADSTNATIIGEEGGVDAVLESMAANDSLDEDVLLNSLHLIDKMCNHTKSLEKIVTPEMVANIGKVMEQNYAQTETVSVCARILEKMTRAKHGLEAAKVAESADHSVSKPLLVPLQKLVEAWSKEGGEPVTVQSAAATQVLKVFTRLVKMDPNTAKTLQKSFDTVLDVVGVYPDDEKLARTAAKLLVSTMDGGVSDVLDKIKRDPEQAEKLLSLLSTLAVDGDLAEEIAKSGGVAALVGALEYNLTPKAKEELVRAITRLATSASSLDEIVTSGALSQLISTLKGPHTPDDLKALILQALNKITAQARTASHVAAIPGAVEAVLDTVQNTKQPVLVERGMLFVESICKEPAVLEKTHTDPAILTGACVAAAAKIPDDFVVQKEACHALKSLLSLAEKDTLLHTNIVESVCLPNMDPAHCPLDVVRDANSLLAELAKIEPGCVESCKARVFDAVVNAACAFPEDAQVRKAAVDVVALISDDSLVDEKVARIADFARKLTTQTATPADVANTPFNAMALGVLAMVPANVPRLKNADAAKPLIAVMAAIATSSPDDHVDELIKTFAVALLEMLPHGKGDDVFPLEDCFKSAVAVVKLKADSPVAAPALDLLEGVAHVAPANLDLVKLGAVEACSKAIVAAHDADLTILEPAVHTLAAVAASDVDGVADRNGQKACLAALVAMTQVKQAEADAANSSSGDPATTRPEDDDSVTTRPQSSSRRSSALSGLHVSNSAVESGSKHNDPDAGLSRATASALKVLEQVAASGQDRAEHTRAQGAVDAVFAAMDSWMDDPDVTSQCEKTLKRLVSEQDSLKVLDDLKAVPLDQIARGEPATMRSAASVVSKLGLLMSCGDFAGGIQANGGPEALANLLKAAVSAPDSRQIAKTKANLVKSCIQALGRAAGKGVMVPGAVELVPSLVAELRESPNADVVNAVASLVGDADVCRALVDQGCVEALLPLLDSDELRNPVLACLSALAKQDPEHAAKKIVDGGALPFVCHYVSDELADSGPTTQPTGGISAAVALLAALVDAADADALMDAGTLTLIDQILDAVGSSKRTVDAKQAPEIAAVSGLIKGIAQKHPGQLTDKLVAGSARKLATLVSALVPAGASDGMLLDDSLDDLADLMDVLAQGSEDSAQKLQEAGANDALIKAMNALPNNVGLAAKCATALGKISGSGLGGLDPLLDKCASLADDCLSLRQEPPKLEEALEELAKTVNLASNLILQPGVLADQPLADKAATTARNVLDKLYKLPPSDSVQKPVANTLTLLSRLNNVEGLEPPDFDLTLDCLDGAFAAPMGDQLKAAACASLNSLCVKGGPAAVRSVAARGMLQPLQDAAEGLSIGRLGPSELQGEAAGALRAVLQQAVSNAAQLASEPDGAAALAKLLSTLAQSSDPNALSDALDQVAHVDGGPQALLEALTFLNYQNDFDGPGNADAASAICETLCDCAKHDPDSVVPWKIDHVSALCKGKRCLKPAANDVLGIHGPTLATPEGAALCMGNYDPTFDDLLLEDIGQPSRLAEDPSNRETTPERANTAAGLIAKAVAHGDPGCTAGLLDAGVPKGLTNALKDQPRKLDETFVQNDLYDLNALADTCGIDAMDMPKDAVRSVSDAMKAHPYSEYIQTTGQLLIDKLKTLPGSSNDDRIKEKLGQLEGFHSAAQDWQMIASADGNYFYNGVTGESSWDQPADHLAFMDELDDLSILVDDPETDLSSAVTPQAVAGLTGALGTHARDPGVCGRVAKILNNVGKDPSSLNDLCDLGALEDLIPALDHCGGDPDFVNDATELLANMAKLDKMKARLSLKEYVRVLNQTSLDHMASLDVVKRCVSILSNLSYNNAEVIGYCFEFNVPYTLKWALQQHLADLEACEIGVFCANCLLTDDEPQKKYVCEQLTPEFVACLQLYASEDSFFAKACRCMGSMSILDECVVLMTAADVVPLIVNGMDVHLVEAPKTLKIAVELLSNFGATEDEAHDAHATEKLVEGGAIQAVKRVLEEHANAKQASLLTACFDALYNVGNDEDAAKVITDEGLCEIAVDCLEQFDFDANLRRQCVKLISVLTYNDFSVERLTQAHATPALLEALSTHGDDEEFVVDTVLALSNLVTVPKVARIFLEKTYLKEVLDLLDVYDNHAEVVKFVLIALIRLAADDDVSAKTAQQGMPYIMRSTANFVEDSEVLSLIFELLGQLAYVKSNLRCLVGAGGIKVLLDTLDTFDDSPELIIKTITTLDNLVSADVEYASVVLERDGEGLLKQCKAKWSSDPAVVRSVDAALLSIRAMIAQKEKQRTNRAALFARLGEDHMDVNKLKTERLDLKSTEAEPDEDPIKKFRETLSSGLVLTQWDKGKPVNRKFAVNADWTAFLTRDTARGSAIQSRAPLKSVRRAQAGYGAGHQVKSIMSSKPKPTVKEDLCFVLKGLKEEDLICFQAKTKQDAAKLVQAIETTLNVFSKWPHRLING